MLPWQYCSFFWFSKEVKLDFWCFFDWFVHGTFEKFSENIFSPNVLRDHSLTQVLVQVPDKYNHTILFIIIWNMQHDIGTPATHVKFTWCIRKIRMYLIPGKYELSASGYKSPLLVHKIAFPGAWCLLVKK